VTPNRPHVARHTPDSPPAAVALSADALARLRGALDSLLQLTDQLGGLLAAERERLVARDWDAILRLSEDKEKLVQSQEFEKSCAAAAADSAAASVPAMLESAGLGAAHAALRTRAAELQRANRESRALLDHHLARVDTALRLMNRADAAPSSRLGLYGRDGYGRIGGTGRRLAEA
jgi:flagellar biosynthesis/type III secretory pathway chaperone